MGMTVTPKGHKLEGKRLGKQSIRQLPGSGTARPKGREQPSGGWRMLPLPPLRVGSQPNPRASYISIPWH